MSIFGSGNMFGQGMFGGENFGPFGSVPWLENSNVAAVFIADDPYVTRVSGDVSVWTAQQSFKNDGTTKTPAYTLTQSTPDDRPLWEPTGFNEKGSIQYDGVSEYLSTTDADFVNLVDGTDSPITVITTWQVLTVTPSVFYEWCRTVDGSSLYRLRDSVGNYRTARVDDGVGVATHDSATGVSTSHRVIVNRHLGTTVSQRIDGTEDSNSPGALDVGALTASTHFSIGAALANSAGAHSFAHLRIRALHVILNDDTSAINAIETWALKQ